MKIFYPQLLGRGWERLDKILKKLDKKMKIGEVLRMLLEEKQVEPKQKGYHLPGVYQVGRKIYQNSLICQN